MNVEIESSWKKLLSEEFEKDYFKDLVDFVQLEYQEHPNGIFPKGDQIFRAFDACPVDQVKVVVLGQDPYPTKGHAHGLCFSCDSNVKPLPKSLSNIFKELQSDLGKEIPSSGDLSHWAKQGVLLLNATLTVREGQPDSHAGKGWEQFTDAVISKLNDEKTGIIYVLWGSKAQQKAASVDEEQNLILKASHPSPLSAYRGFLGSRPFSQCNLYLESNGKTPINW